MPKQVYPGLILMPPSDRKIAKHQLSRWTFLIITVTFGVLTLNAWLTPPDTTTSCQFILNLDTSPDSHNTCGQPEPDLAMNDEGSDPKDIVVSELSRETNQLNPQPSKLALSSPLNQPSTQSDVRRVSQNTSKPLATASFVRPIAARQEEGSNTTQTAAKPAFTPTHDTHLAEQGDAFAQYRLGKFYAKHRGAETPESMMWYMKASTGLHRLAETGNGKAMYVLGVMYTYGYGVKKDAAQARSWLTRAVEHQIAAARPILASLDEHHLAQSSRRASNRG